MFVEAAPAAPVAEEVSDVNEAVETAADEGASDEN